VDDPGNIHSAPPEHAGGHASQDSPGPHHRDRLRDHGSADPIKSFTTPLNPRRRPLGRRSCEQQFPVRHTTERRAWFSGQVSAAGGQRNPPEHRSPTPDH
jgi:hypothetical protein